MADIDRAVRAVRTLQDLNSAFPETQAFLRARGLSNVRELDARGKQELTEYLVRVLRRMAN